MVSAKLTVAVAAGKFCRSWNPMRHYGVGSVHPTLSQSDLVNILNTQFRIYFNIIPTSEPRSRSVWISRLVHMWHASASPILPVSVASTTLGELNRLRIPHFVILSILSLSQVQTLHQYLVLKQLQPTSNTAISVILCVVYCIQFNPATHI
jgi:hypothetical protein